MEVVEVVVEVVVVDGLGHTRSCVCGEQNGLIFSNKYTCRSIGNPSGVTTDGISDVMLHSFFFILIESSGEPMCSFTVITPGLSEEKRKW